MLSKTCYIAGAGEFSEGRLPSKGDFVIAADGGYSHLQRLGIKTDLIIGDFDSLEDIPDMPGVITHPSVKDDTDMMLAVKAGMSAGGEIFILNGGLGGRLDHTLANIQTLAYIAEKGKKGFLVGENTCVTAVAAGRVSFRNTAKGFVSVFCNGENADGVSLNGFKYGLSNGVLSSAFPLGVSNEFTGVPASVSVESGTLIILWAGVPEDCGDI